MFRWPRNREGWLDGHRDRSQKRGEEMTKGPVTTATLVIDTVEETFNIQRPSSGASLRSGRSINLIGHHSQNDDGTPKQWMVREEAINAPTMKTGGTYTFEIGLPENDYQTFVGLARLKPKSAFIDLDGVLDTATSTTNNPTFQIVFDI